MSHEDPSRQSSSPAFVRRQTTMAAPGEVSVAVAIASVKLQLENVSSCEEEHRKALRAFF